MCKGINAKKETNSNLHFRSLKYRVKGKVRPRKRHAGPEGEQRYSSTLSLTSVLDGGRWSAPRPGHFTPRKETRYSLYRRLGGLQDRSGQVGSILPPQWDSIPDLPARSGSLYRLRYSSPRKYRVPIRQ